jgi:hypothetical protein
LSAALLALAPTTEVELDISQIYKRWDYRIIEKEEQKNSLAAKEILPEGTVFPRAHHESASLSLGPHIRRTFIGSATPKGKKVPLYIPYEGEEMSFFGVFLL